jgi:hypothetical protein
MEAAGPSASPLPFLVTGLTVSPDFSLGHVLNHEVSTLAGKIGPAYWLEPGSQAHPCRTVSHLKHTD